MAQHKLAKSEKETWLMGGSDVFNSKVALVVSPLFLLLTPVVFSTFYYEAVTEYSELKHALCNSERPWFKSQPHHP